MTFWNKVQGGVSRAAAEAEKQAKIARLSVQIGGVESTLRQKKQELGDAALELIRAQKLTEPSFDPILQGISEHEARLAELRAELAELQSPAGPAGTSSPGATSTT